MISPQEGLLKIIAHGNNINTNGFGREVRELFMDIRDVISAKYGAPKMLDGLVSGSLWRNDRDWMAGLVKNERHLKALWDLQSKRPNRITVLVLKADAISEDTGFLLLSYEFQGFEKICRCKGSEGGVRFLNGTDGDVYWARSAARLRQRYVFQRETKSPRFPSPAIIADRAHRDPQKRKVGGVEVGRKRLGVLQSDSIRVF